MRPKPAAASIRHRQYRPPSPRLDQSASGCGCRQVSRRRHRPAGRWTLAELARPLNSIPTRSSRSSHNPAASSPSSNSESPSVSSVLPLAAFALCHLPLRSAASTSRLPSLLTAAPLFFPLSAPPLRPPSGLMVARGGVACLSRRTAPGNDHYSLPHVLFRLRDLDAAGGFFTRRSQPAGLVVSSRAGQRPG